MHTPFVQDHHLEPEVTPQAPQTLVESSVPVSNLNQSPKNLSNEEVFDDFDDLLIDEDIPPATQPIKASSYAQSSAFVKRLFKLRLVQRSCQKKNLLKLGRKLLESLRMTLRMSLILMRL